MAPDPKDALSNASRSRQEREDGEDITERLSDAGDDEWQEESDAPGAEWTEDRPTSAQEAKPKRKEPPSYVNWLAGLAGLILVFILRDCSGR